MGSVSVSLPPELEAKLKALVEKTGKSRSKIVAEALEAYFGMIKRRDGE